MDDFEDGVRHPPDCGFGMVGASVRNERDGMARERNLLLGVTHELETPLASVQLGLDSLRRLNLRSKTKPSLEQHAERCSDLGNLIEDMPLRPVSNARSPSTTTRSPGRTWSMMWQGSEMTRDSAFRCT